MLEQKVREAREMLELEKIAAAKRRKATQNNNSAKENKDRADTATLPYLNNENKKGESRNIVDKELGL